MKNRAGWLLLTFAMVAIPLAGLWWVTAGEFDLKERINFGDIYEAQARSLLDGRTDISCQVASGEAFVRNGKCYTYFGILPGLMRLPFLPVDPADDGRASRTAVWLSQILLLAAVGMILREAGHAPGTLPFAGYLLLVAFGSTIPHMLSWPTTYMEAICWAVAFAVASMSCLLRWARVRRDGWLLAACILSILALFSRVSTGVVPMFTVGFFAMRQLWRPRHRSLAAAAVILLIGLSIGGYAAYNHSRFGLFWNSIPVQYHVQYDADRLKRIGGILFHPEKSPLLSIEYLFHAPRFRASYPWLEFRPGNSTTVPLGGMDIIEPHAGVVWFMPALIWLALAGWFATRDKVVRWPLLSPFVAMGMLVSVAAVSHRYIHEFLLLLVPAGAFGLSWATATRPKLLITLLLSAWSLFASWALALVGQREVMLWVSDDAVERHRTTRFQVDRWFGLNPKYPSEFAYMKDSLPFSVPGAHVRIFPYGSEFEFDGRLWQRKSGPPVHRFKTRVRFETSPGDSTQLLFAGKPPEADLISLDCVWPGHYRVRLDHWGTASEFGPGFDLVLGRNYLFDFELDRLNRRMRVTIDGAVMAERKAALWRWYDTDVTLAPAVELLPGE